MRFLLLILSDASRDPWAKAVAAAAQVANPLIVTGTPSEAAQTLASQNITPSHIVIDIGTRGPDILPEIDQLAQQCEPGTRVIAVGDTSDPTLIQEILARGVLSYMPLPLDPAELAQALAGTVSAPAAPTPYSATPGPATSGSKRVIAFLSAASGDGASTVALNTAYALSQLAGSTVLVDMDYQFGMTAKHLNLQNQYGIRELFDHPERGVDATLIRRMAVSYGNLHVITAPSELRFLPNVSDEAIRSLVATLKQSYDNIVLDLPHLWTPWIAAACQQATHLGLVSQLWLKSVSHSARMMRIFRELYIPQERILTIINRSGAQYKEAIEPKDFERVCGIPIRFALANDIQTITASEGEAKSVLEVGDSELAQNILHLARAIAGLPQDVAELNLGKGGGIFSRRKRG